MPEKEPARRTVTKAFKEILMGYDLSENLKFLLFTLANWIVGILGGREKNSQ